MFNKRTFSVDKLLQQATHQRTIIFSLLIIGALIAFEIFNYSTTEFAMADLLGDLKFGSMTWATILALAFCGIDFAGIARLFTPEQGIDEPIEVWYLFGAWIIAATMNAILTWWGISIAILQHQSLGSAVISREMLLKVVPIFVAVMVWLSRVLIIGTFSVAGERLFWRNEKIGKGIPGKTRTYNPSPRYSSSNRSSPRPSSNRRSPTQIPETRPVYSNSFSPSPKPLQQEKYSQPAMAAKSNDNSETKSYL